MSLENALTSTRLTEKPWQVGAVARLAGCVLLCMFMGGVISLVASYLELHPRPPGVRFGLLAVGASVSWLAAVILLGLPWRNPERYLIRIIWLLSCLYVGIVLTWLMGKSLGNKAEIENSIVMLVIGMVAFQGSAIVLVHFFLREHSTTWAEGFGFRDRPVLSLGLGVGVGVIILFPALKLQDICIRLFETFSYHAGEQHTVEILRQTAGIFERIAAGVGVIVIAPVGEELLFRGILYPTVKRIYGQQAALWGTCILFGAIHFNLASFLSLVMLALVLVWLYEHTGNLLAPIAVHCVFNATNFIALYWVQNLPASP